MIFSSSRIELILNEEVLHESAITETKETILVKLLKYRRERAFTENAVTFRCFQNGGNGISWRQRVLYTTNYARYEKKYLFISINFTTEYVSYQVSNLTIYSYPKLKFVKWVKKNDKKPLKIAMFTNHFTVTAVKSVGITTNDFITVSLQMLSIMLLLNILDSLQLISILLQLILSM